MIPTSTSALAAALNVILSSQGPKLGRRFRCGQTRCTEIRENGRYAQLIDWSERRNFAASKYMPHQGQRETERRRARGW